jgi:hypothetical protein
LAASGNELQNAIENEKDFKPSLFFDIFIARAPVASQTLPNII